MSLKAITDHQTTASTPVDTLEASEYLDLYFFTHIFHNEKKVLEHFWKLIMISKQGKHISKQIHQV